MATIKDVAKKAGVSVATVSNMINNKVVISDDKYQRIKMAMQELNYRPSYNAQNLKHKTTKIIGVVLPSLDEHYNDIYTGIAEVLEKDKYIIVIKLTQNDVNLEYEMLDHLVDIGVSGIILVPSDFSDYKKYNELINNGIPLIFIERRIKRLNCSNVIFDNKTLVFQLTKQLMENYSAEDIKLIVGRQGFSSEKDCEEGFLAAIEDNTNKIISVTIGNRAIFNQIYSELIMIDNIPRCIIASSIHLAKEINEVCNILNYQVDIFALAGDNWNTTGIYKSIYPITRRAMHLGNQAAKIFEQLIANKRLIENRTINIPNEKQQIKPVDAGITGQKGKSLKILAFNCDATWALEKLSYSFKNNFGVSCEFDKRGYNDLRSEIIKQIDGSSSNYDLIMIDIPWIKRLISSGFLYDITNDVYTAGGLLEKYPTGIKNAFFKNDTSLFTVPIVSTIQMIFYRKDVFEDGDIKAKFLKRNGYDLSVPKTWTEFNLIAEFFNKRSNPLSEFEYGTAISALEPIGLVNEFIPRQWAFNGKFVDEWGKLVIDSDENVRALDNFITSYKYSPKECENYFWDDIFELLLNGEIVMAHGFASHYQPGNRRYTGSSYDKFISVTPVPKGKSMLGGWALGVNRNSSNIELGCGFLRWLFNNSIDIANMRLCGCIPTIPVCQNASLRSSYPWLKFVNETFTNAGMREIIYDSNEKQVQPDIIDEILSKQISRAIHEEIDSTAALNEVKAQITNLIKNKEM